MRLEDIVALENSPKWNASISDTENIPAFLHKGNDLCMHGDKNLGSCLTETLSTCY